MPWSVFFNDTATTEIYTLSLHDALPILNILSFFREQNADGTAGHPHAVDRKSTRLNSSHDQSSYAVFCLKKKKNEHFQKSRIKKVLFFSICPSDSAAS